MKNKINKIVSLLKKVQKIPYYCLRIRIPSKLLKVKKGACYEKNVFLGKEYEKLGIPVKYMLMDFNWSDLPIPKEITNKNSSKIGKHLALKIKINGKWIFVDPTWDLKLEKAGFPITKNWDGKEDTKLAVNPLNMREDRNLQDKMIVAENQEFYDLLNKYLEKIRSK